MRLLFALGLALIACVPIDPLDLDPPDVGPAECVAASECALPAVAEVACVDGRCAIAACPPGTADADGERENGCEACDARPGPDVCDGLDTDCDGRLDEDGDGTVDACGACDTACVGDEATHACREDTCVVEACSPGRYAVGGPDAGCPCDADAPSVERTALRPAGAPISPRLAFPGDGAPGAIVWTAVEAGRHRLVAWSLTPDGYPIGPPDVIATLDGPHDVRHAWFDAEGEPVAVLAAPDGGRERLVEWRGATPRALGDDCTADRCLIARLPDGRAGLIRLQTRPAGFRVLGPDGGVLAELPADLERPDPELVDAACISSDGCVVTIRRGGLSVAGLAEAELEGVDEADAATIDGRILAVVRAGDQLVAAAIDGADEPVLLPVTDWRAPRLLQAPGGGAWLVALDDGRPAALQLDARLQPMGEPRRLTAGFVPDGLAAPGIFFDHGMRAATVDRSLWVGAPDTAPVIEAAPSAVAGRWVYRARSGVASVSTAGPDPAEATLVLRQPSPPDVAPAVALVDDRPLLLGAAPAGLTRVDLETGERWPVALEVDGEAAALRPSTEVALHRDGALAVVAEDADGRPLVGWGDAQDDAIDLAPSTLGPERAPRLVGGDGALWLVTRLDLGEGHQTVVRRLDGAHPPRVVARRATPGAAAAAHGDRLVLLWLDRLSDRCGPGPDRVRVTSIGPDDDVAPAAEPSLFAEPACPRHVAIAAHPHGIYALMSTDDAVHMVALDPRGRPAAPPVRVAADAPGALGVGDAGPTAAWLTPESIQRLPFDCRDDGARP